MEPLDLKRHDAEDYLGKLVLVNGAEYVIGERLGAGVEKTAHKLFNRRSAICMHVIKLWHFQEEADFFRPRGRADVIAAMRRDPLLGAAIPVSLFIQGHNGYFELQDAGGYEHARETPAIKELMEKAGSLMNNGDFAAARSVYAQVLNADATHSVALHNLATAHSRLGDYDQASQIEALAVDIEPNSMVYRIGQIKIHGSAGLLRIASAEFEFLKSQYPYFHDADDYAIQVYLMRGSPEKAGQLLSQRTLSDQRIAEVQQEIAAAVTAKARALPILGQAMALLMSGDPADPNILRLLKEAYKTYDKDPLTAINLGLALGRAGDFKGSSQMLSSVLEIVRMDLYKLCSANLAFNLIRVSGFEGAMTLLDVTMQVLTMGRKGSIRPEDLPGVAIWVEESKTTEEHIETAFQLLNLAIRQCPAKATESVRRLFQLYREAAAR